MTIKQQNTIMYAALREIASVGGSSLTWEEEAIAMENAARKAIDTVEACPSPKSLAELREISLAADRVANEWSDRVDLCTSEELSETERQYNAARELSHMAFRAMVEHEDYLTELMKEREICG